MAKTVRQGNRRRSSKTRDQVLERWMNRHSYKDCALLYVGDRESDMKFGNFVSCQQMTKASQILSEDFSESSTELVIAVSAAMLFALSSERRDQVIAKMKEISRAIILIMPIDPSDPLSRMSPANLIGTYPCSQEQSGSRWIASFIAPYGIIDAETV